MNHLSRVNCAVLAGAGLAFIAGTPAVLAAARVSSPWALAGATAVVTAVVVAGGMAWDLHKRRDESRGGFRRAGDGCLVLADGTLPLVREVSDPTRLGAHRPAPVEAESGAPANEDEAPPYVPRDLDGDVRERLAAGGFVLLVGDSTAGLTRMAIEALQATLPDHILIAPVGVDAIPAAISKAAGERNCVLWLDDLERFLGPDGLNAAHIERLLGGTDHHRVIAATLRAAEQARLTAELREDDGTGQGLRDVSEVLNQAWQIRIARLFSVSELERAAVRDWDPRIATAIRHAERCGIAEYLAAGPALLRDWEDARSSAQGSRARGAALVSAAIDIRRAGFISPIPRHLLDEVHEHYLDNSRHAAASPEPLAEAWAWATSRQSARGCLLNPVGGNSVEVPAYLTDTVQRRAGPLDRVPERVVRSALASACATDAVSLAWTAYSQGRWQLAADSWRAACELLPSDLGSGQERADILTCRANLAMVLRHLGRLDEAEVESRKVLATALRALGPDHPDSIASRGSLALVLRDLGKLPEAEAESRRVLAARQRMLGPDHPSTMTSRNNLALVLRSLGRLDEAETESRAALAIALQALGPDHPGTMVSRNNLALVLRSLGRLDEAEAESRAILAIALQALGPDHPGTLGSRNNLAGVLHDQGRLREAEAEIRAVLAARQLVLGPDHPDTLASRNNLARVLTALRWHDEAEAEIRAVLAIRQRVLGPDHPDTLASRNNLAGVLQERGRLHEAETEIRAVLAIRQRVLGPDHPIAMACRNSLAGLLRALGRPNEAEAEMRAVSAAGKRVQGPSHPDTPLPEVDGAEIRRLRRSDGMPVKAIARLTGASRNTLRSALTNPGPENARQAKGSIVDEVEPRIRELLQLDPDMPATTIAERIGWDRGLTVLRNRIRQLRPAYLAPEAPSHNDFALEQDRPA